MIHFKETPEFQKEYKKLLKKYRLLNTSIDRLKDVLIRYPLGKNAKNYPIVKRSQDVCIIKAKIACPGLRGLSIRIVYAYFEDQNHIEFLEIYFKGDKTNHNIKRIEQYMLLLNE